MRFVETGISGLYLVEREDRQDERGFFARTYCREEFLRHGLDFEIRQCNLAYSSRPATLRGMHFQNPPHQEIKLVSCLKGSLFDCVVDMRRDSPTYLRHFGVKLDAFGPALYVPKGFAHGYQTLVADTIIQYQVNEYYSPEFEGGLRWNDPALGIEWPECGERIISEKDAGHPLSPR